MSKSYKIPRIICIICLSAFAVYASAWFGVRTVFPRLYANEVTYASHASGLDESLIRAVIWTESKYKENAVSPKGASGLMQLMPSTRKYLAETFGFAPDCSPQSDVLLGSLYLALLIDKTGSEEGALMAYNAGLKNAERFLAGDEPFRETEEYVKRVRFAQRIYRGL